MIPVDIEITNEFLIIHLERLRDKIATLKEKIEIPLSVIKNVSTKKVHIDELKTIKLIAVRLPSYHAGSFYHFGEGKEFYVFGDKEKCVTLTLQDDYKYKEIIFEADNKEEIGNKITQALTR